MYQKALYQTLKGSGSRKMIESNGPFECTRSDAWLGHGCYFWETFIEYAHWWGEKSHEGSYIICRTHLSIPKDSLYDLEDTETLKEFNELRSELEKTYPGKELKFSFVLEYCKKIKVIEHKAIRARFIGAIKECDKENDGHYVCIKPGGFHRYRLDTMPQVQVCIMDRSCVGKDNYKVIYSQIAEGYI